jgi:hypothetical protein
MPTSTADTRCSTADTCATATTAVEATAAATTAVGTSTATTTAGTSTAATAAVGSAATAKAGSRVGGGRQRGRDNDDGNPQLECRHDFPSPFGAFVARTHSNLRLWRVKLSRIDPSQLCPIPDIYPASISTAARSGRKYAGALVAAASVETRVDELVR